MASPTLTRKVTKAIPTIEEIQEALDELYPQVPKFLVFQHSECHLFWIQKGQSSLEVRPCPACLAAEVRAVAAFSNFYDAMDFKIFLMKLDYEFKMQAYSIMYMAEKIDGTRKAEWMPFWMHIPDYQFFEVVGRKGYLFKEWLFWDPAFPTPRIMRGVRHMVGALDWNYGPNPSEWVM